MSKASEFSTTGSAFEPQKNIAGTIDGLFAMDDSQEYLIVPTAKYSRPNHDLRFFTYRQNPPSGQEATAKKLGIIAGAVSVVGSAISQYAPFGLALTSVDPGNHMMKLS